MRMVSVNHMTSFLGELQHIAFRLMLSSCVYMSVCVCLCVCMCLCVSVSVCVCVCIPRLWTSGERFEIETSFFLNCAE